MRHVRANRQYRIEVEQFIETFEQADRVCDLNLRALESFLEFTSRVESILACSEERPCGDILCSVCGRDYRMWFAPQLLALLRNGVPVCVLTILLRTVRGHHLPDVDIRSEQDRLRKRMVRAGFTAVVGGMEAAYCASADLWTVHVHVLAFGDTAAPLKELRKMFRRDVIEEPIERDNLRDPVTQVTYLQKFSTYHRPGQAGFSGRGRAYPMKAAQIAQLARWTEGRTFGEFLFAIGFRRRGHLIRSLFDFDELRDGSRES